MASFSLTLLESYLDKYISSMWQLADEAVNLFDATISDMGVTINYALDGQDPIPSISEYIETMRISLWDSAFFLEFSSDKGVHKNKSSEDQVNFKQAMRRVLFRYFKFVLFSKKALFRTPAFFAAYLDKDSEDCMFTEAILKAWDPVHLPTCGWYLDCPLKRPPSSEVTLRESLEPALKGQIASIPKVQAKGSVKKGGKRKKSTPDVKKSTPEAKKSTPEAKKSTPEAKKSTPEAKKSTPEAKKSTPVATNSNVVIEVASILEDVETSTVNLASPFMKEDELGAKRYRPTPLTQVVSVPSSNVSTFQLLPKLKGMALVPPPISSSSTSSEFILNDSFVRMVEEKQHTKVWPKCYDIVVFLTKVHIPILKSFIYHFSYSTCIHTCLFFFTFPSNSTLSCVYSFLKAGIIIFKVNSRRSLQWTSLLRNILMDCKCLVFLIHLLKSLTGIGKFQTSWLT
jgi:hypothetical protein